MRDPDTGGSKGFAFVNYDCFEAADASIEAMNGQYLCGRAISVGFAFKKDGTKGERHGSMAERLLAAANPSLNRPHTMFAASDGIGGGMAPPPPGPPPGMMGGMMPPPGMPGMPPGMMGMPPPPMPPPGMMGGMMPPSPGMPPHGAPCELPLAWPPLPPADQSQDYHYDSDTDQALQEHKFDE
mmetsp:Transcript_8572/g.18664  ORF Transcript_8572/g.18664 Transcript_8572/m.18664 type:complete len:183 (+) Transcript_8572:1-549(+)